MEGGFHEENTECNGVKSKWFHFYVYHCKQLVAGASVLHQVQLLVPKLKVMIT